MSRLTHSDKGFVRSLQISSAQLFVFVEGALDRVFAERVLVSSIPQAIKFEVRATKELPWGTGGKASLMETFRKLRRWKLLSSNRLGKRLECLFIADKDVDDVTRNLLRSPHICYSPTYDLEGHLIYCGDLVRATADAALMTAVQASTHIGTQRDFITNLVSLWKEWAVLCMVSQIERVNVGCTFDRHSAVNGVCLQPTDTARVLQFVNGVAQNLAKPAAQINELYARCERRFETSVAQGNPLKFFKGKWLKVMMEHFFRTRVQIPDAHFNGFADRLMSTLVAQAGTHARCACCAHYAGPLRALAVALR